VQERIRTARVHVVGAGAVAGPALLSLAQAGVGTLYVDDGADVAEGDASWLFGPEHVGQPRLLAAMEAVRGASAFVEARPYSTMGVHLTAALVCVTDRSTASKAAERARLSGLPHVVALAEGDGGEVVAVPSGAPCYSCASRPGAGVQPRPGAAAAVGLLGAVELLLMLGGLATSSSGRHTGLVFGLPDARPTSRIPGCDCANTY
jgi:hypothetical protein